MTVTLQPGITLGATDALRYQRGRTWTDEQVAYLIALAYQTGRLHGWAEDMAELADTWQHYSQPRRTRADRQATLEEHQRNPPGGAYMGGPVDWDTSKPLREAG